MMRRPLFLFVGLLFGIALGPVGAAEPAQIVRLTQPPTIDGDASDWPASGVLEMSSSEGKARLRLGYDDTCLYALVEVDDASPLKNGATRPEEMIKGGDTVAFYFQTKPGDEQRVAIALLQGKPAVYVYRPVSTVKKPYTFVSPVGEARFDFVAPLEGAQVALKPNGTTGYIVEAALPWKSLGLAPPPSSFAFDAQVIYSDPGGTQNVGSLWLFARDGPGLTIEDLPTEAKLYPDTWGKANLVAALHATESASAISPVSAAGSEAIEVDLPRAGRLTVNITDDSGWILRELVMAQKFPAGKQTIPWDGRDRYGEPLPPGTYHWKALLFDGMKTEFMGSVGNSGRPPYRTDDGLGSMGGQHGVEKCVARDDGGIYMANALQEGPPAMRKIDAQTGKALWMRSAGGFGAFDQVAADEGMACVLNSTGRAGSRQVDLVRIDPKTGLDASMGTGPSKVTLKLAVTGRTTAGLAIAGGKAWFSVPEENRIGMVDLTNGTVGADLSVSKPMGLARLDDKTLLVCSETKVLAVDTASGSQRVVIDGLEAPQAVCFDTEENFYVSDLGKIQQIKKFAPDGKKLLATWGAAGGKPATMVPYDPLAFSNVTSLVIGPDGNLWLAESSTPPRRYVKMTRDGTWLEDFCGPIAYNTFGPDLDDFSRVYYNIQSAGPSFVEAIVDYDEYQKDPTNTAKCWKIAAIHDMGLGADGVTRNDVMSEVGSTGYGHVIVFKGTNGKRYFFRLSKANRGGSPIGAGLWVEKAGRWVPCAFISHDPTKTPSWVDLNGDGLIQPEEQYTDVAVKEAAWIDRDLTLHGLEGKLKPSSVTEAGAPRYDKSALAPYLSDEAMKSVKGATTMVSRETDGVVYYIANIGPHLHLSFWDRATENRLSKVKDGKVQWIVGKHEAHPDATEFSTNSSIPGVIDGVVLVGNIEPADYVAYTEDGFVLGDVMLDANGTHPKVGPTVIQIESLNGLYVKDPKSGKNMLFAISSGDDRILAVSGPGETTRLEGTIALKGAAPFAAPADGKLTIPYSPWYGNTGMGVAVDGTDTEWNPDVPQVSIVDNAKVVADVRLRRYDGALHLFATILDQSPTSAGEGVRLLLAGDATGHDPVQLVLTPVNDETGAWKGKAALLRGGKEVDGSTIKVAVTPRWQGLGYHLEAMIPLTLLPEFSADAPQTVREVAAKNTKGGPTKEMKTLPDLKAPLFMDIQVLRQAAAGSSGEVSYANGKFVEALLPSPHDR